MNEVPVNLDRLKREDVYSVASALLYSLKGVPKYSVVSELFYILDHQNFLRMIKYFGGQEIRIPSSEEISQTLKLLLLYQYHEVEEVPWSEALRRAEIPQSESHACRARLAHLRKILQSQEIGGRNYK